MTNFQSPLVGKELLAIKNIDIFHISTLKHMLQVLTDTLLEVPRKVLMFFLIFP